MKQAPPRADEAAALAALRRLEVLDTQAEAEFDALAQAASAACGTPIALLSLIDADRQWFKANVGLPGVTQTTREPAFCAHAVLGESIFEVPDALQDARFSDNPLVVGNPHVRFYAGVPLQLSGGECIGTLCVIDHQPRRLDPMQREVLRCLGLAAAKALEGRRAMRELVAANAATARAALIEDHSTDAIISVDANGRILRWNSAAESMLGYDRSIMVGCDMHVLLPAAHGAKNFDCCLDRQENNYETVLVRRGGQLLDVAVTAVPEFDAEGRLSGKTKFIRDISDRMRAARELASREVRARRMYESTPAMLHSVDRQGRLMAVSDQWLNKLGYTRSEVIGRSAPELLTAESRERSLKVVLPKLFAEGRVDDVEYQIITRDGRVLDVLVSAIIEYDGEGRPTNSLSVMDDVTERRRAERALDTARRDLQNILDAVPSTIAYWDRDGRNRFANRSCLDWLGVGPGALRSMSIREALGQEVFERNQHRIEAALRGEPQTFENAIPRRDGPGMRHALTHYKPDVVEGQVLGCYVFAHDVSEIVEGRQRLAAAQRDNEALLRTLDLHALVSVTDLTGRIVDANGELCKVSGYTREELIGTDYMRLNSGHHERGFWSDMWESLTTGKPWRGEVCNRAKDGRLYWVDSVVAPFLKADGSIEKYICIQHDITSAKLTEQRLRSSEAFLDRAGQIAGVGGWELDLRSQQLHWSAQTRRIHEVPPEFQPRVDGAIAFYAPEAQPLIQEAVRAGMEFGTPWDLELRLITATGKSIWARAVGTPEFEEGRAVRLVGAFQDITERKQAELELRETSSLLHTVLESASEVSIIATDPQLTIKVFNKGAQRLLGYSAEELVGRATPALIHDVAEMQACAQAMSVQLGRPVEGGEVFTDVSTLGHSREWSYVRKDGSRVLVSLVVTAMCADDGSLFGYLGVAHDVTLQKQAERDLRHAVHRAEAANRAKSQFLANMSHEIRTPMNAVIGLSYLLERTPLDAEQVDTLDKIKLASKSLLSIINDVLDLSKIEASEMQLESAPFMLGSVLSELSALSQLQADARGVQFTVQTAADLPLAIEGDPTRLRQVLTNLLSNAIKFTECGGVLLRVEQLAAETGRVRLRFVVEDSGIGIPPEALERLFTPFVQADTSTTRRFGGTGLGLSIVKQLVTLMGGQLGVHSTPGVGSEFWVELEFAVCDSPAVAALVEVVPPAAGPGLQHLRVLVVDDNPINLEVARRILELEGAVVRLAHHGQEAVDQLLAHAQDIDVVLMDVQMPVLDGHDATRRIRSGLGLRQLPVIALTAGISTGDHERAAAAGMNDVVAKPFDPLALVRCIRKHLPAEGAAAVPLALASQATVPASAWPHIEGIDAKDAQQRLGGDVALFGSLLRRLLDDFADLGQPDPTDDAALPDRLAARLHNLKGSAGTLGAGALARLAAQAEVACRAADLGRASRLLAAIGAELASLRESAAGLLKASREAIEIEPPQPAEPLDTQALARLLQQLKLFDLGAIDGFKSLAPHLRLMLGPQAFSELNQQIENLRFSEAACVLDKCFEGDHGSPPRTLA